MFVVEINVVHCAIHDAPGIHVPASRSSGRVGRAELAL
jgi:hypothetical protein